MTTHTAARARFGSDPYLAPFLGTIERRQLRAKQVEKGLTGGACRLEDIASGHEHFGLHRQAKGWVFREWAPNATKIYLIGTFTDWQERDAYALTRTGEHGQWEIHLPAEALHHGDLYRLRIHWHGGSGDRIPAYARRVVQDHHSKIFNAQVWQPDTPYLWKLPDFRRPDTAPIIYESHVGMAQETEGVGTYEEFRTRILPRIARAGYNTVQLMAIMEHPYYGSFGYHVSSFFAASSRFGTPEEFKALVDEAHSLGLAVIIDLVHSHSVSNELEGLARFDGTDYQYFHAGERGHHIAWDSKCFNYHKHEVLHFLLSNCRFWLDEYHVDGFRFDGITSMLYHNHGLGDTFTSYEQYFGDAVDNDAVTYLALANKVIHTLRPDAITIAEDVSGMPGLAAPTYEGGLGFDYRLAMGIADCWFKMVKEVKDEDWHMGHLWHELTNRRADEQTISYVECHDQAIVGGKTMIFELADAAMYTAMGVTDTDLAVERGIPLHNMLRLITAATAGHGYLNFMGNEFGHPEWVDFPREGNNWSYHYARRLWYLRDNKTLRYHYMADFDQEMLKLLTCEHALDATTPHLHYLHEDDKIIAFQRGSLALLFNFHPSKSVCDYHINMPPGEYTLILSTDEPRFGGQGHLAVDQHYFTQACVEHNHTQSRLQVYLPARSAILLKKTAELPNQNNS